MDNSEERVYGHLTLCSVRMRRTRGMTRVTGERGDISFDSLLMPSLRSFLKSTEATDERERDTDRERDMLCHAVAALIALLTFLV